ncbi:MAG: glycoside hydrolase [Opitutaceae bacterium]|jgi:hypothetical protein|nr:glycoside hydrolase [Opitutaceae bacterium]
MNTHNTLPASCLLLCLALSATATPADAQDWEARAKKDAAQDRTVVVFDGRGSPDSMVCDTTVRELNDGSWILYYLGGGDFEPSPDNYIAFSRSRDQGRTWGPVEILDTGLPRSGVTRAQGATELLVTKDRCTLFFSTHSKTWGHNWKSWMMHSADNCKTWSRPEPLPGRLADFTFIRPSIVTRDGRILLPYQHNLGPGKDAPPPPPDNKPWHKELFYYVCNPRLGVLESLDGGRTWAERGDMRMSLDIKYSGWPEPSIVELPGNKIAMLIRGPKRDGVLYYAESADGGKTWPGWPIKTAIPNPSSKVSLFSLGGGAVALLHNPNDKARRPLALWVSFDGMKTWPYRRVLLEHSRSGPKGNINYPDGFVSADRQWLYFAYDDNRNQAVFYAAKLPSLP